MKSRGRIVREGVKGRGRARERKEVKESSEGKGWRVGGMVNSEGVIGSYWAMVEVIVGGSYERVLFCGGASPTAPVLLGLDFIYLLIYNLLIYLTR